MNQGRRSTTLARPGWIDTLRSSILARTACELESCGLTGGARQASPSTLMLWISIRFLLHQAHLFLWVGKGWGLKYQLQPLKGLAVWKTASPPTCLRHGDEIRVSRHSPTPGPWEPDFHAAGHPGGHCQRSRRCPLCLGDEGRRVIIKRRLDSLHGSHEVAGWLGRRHLKALVCKGEVRAVAGRDPAMPRGRQAGRR